MGVEFFKKVFKLKSEGYPFGEMLTPLVIFGKGLGLWICEEQIPFPALSVVYGEFFFASSTNLDTTYSTFTHEISGS